MRLNKKLLGLVVMISLGGSPITQAQQIVQVPVASNVIVQPEKVYNKPGTYTGNYSGNIVIASSGITLKNMVIEGNVIISSNVVGNQVIFDNVQIKGKLIVEGRTLEGIKSNKTMFGDVLLTQKESIELVEKEVGGVTEEAHALVVTVYPEELDVTEEKNHTITIKLDETSNYKFKEDLGEKYISTSTKLEGTSVGTNRPKRVDEKTLEVDITFNASKDTDELTLKIPPSYLESGSDYLDAQPIKISDTKNLVEDKRKFGIVTLNGQIVTPSNVRLYEHETIHSAMGVSDGATIEGDAYSVIGEDGKNYSVEAECYDEVTKVYYQGRTEMLKLDEVEKVPTIILEPVYSFEINVLDKNGEYMKTDDLSLTFAGGGSRFMSIGGSGTLLVLVPDHYFAPGNIAIYYKGSPIYIQSVDGSVRNISGKIILP